MTTRNPDGTIKTSVYRKATRTDKYLQFNSHHPTQHKRSVARTLLDGAKNIPSTDADKLSEVQHVVDALKINGYTDQFIRSCHSTTVSTNQSQTSRGFAPLPYLQGISEKIARTLNQFNINVAHKLVMTVGSILIKPKERFSKDLSIGVIYKINCKDCDKVYIGQTSRALRSRTREHKRVIFTGDRNSLLTQHCIKNNHNFHLDDVKIIDRCSQWSKGLFLEVWHSIRDPNAINEHIYIPDIYKALAIPSDVSKALFKHSFAFVSHFIAEEGSSVLTETFSQESFLLSYNKNFYLLLLSCLTTAIVFLNPINSVVIPQSLVLRSVVLG